MQPTPLRSTGTSTREGFDSRGTQQALDTPGVIRALSGARRLRSDESWIEVSSQPSSSSLSSATDEIVTTGLRVQHDSSRRRRRRRLRSLAPTHADVSDRPTSAGGSSQEEYEESESESDRVLNSSTEGLQPSGYHEESHPSGPPSSASEEASSDISEDDDGNSTALGITTAEPVFTPQPNAFSHPPVSAHGRPTHPSSVPNSYFPAQHPPPTRSARHSYPTQRPGTHTPYTLLSPSHQLDHDAALRASLSTLLSCAAAARALPKRDHPPPTTTTTTTNDSSSRIEPSTLRLVPESAILAPPRPTARPRTPSPQDPEKGKRKASSSKDRRDSRKKRRASSSASAAGDDVFVSPTLMTWVVSAGVVVLFSAISFSAGYAIGREVGRVEAASAGVGGWGAGGLSGELGAGCGGEVGRELRKLRWAPTRTVGV